MSRNFIVCYFIACYSMSYCITLRYICTSNNTNNNTNNDDNDIIYSNNNINNTIVVVIIIIIRCTTNYLLYTVRVQLRVPQRCQVAEAPPACTV